MRNKRIRALTMALIVVSVVMIALGVLSYYEKRQFDSKTAEANELQQELDFNTQTVYVAMCDIKKGDTLMTQEMADAANTNDPADANDEETAGAIINNRKQANVYQVSIRSSISQDMYYIPNTVDPTGGVAIVDIPEGQPVMNNMVESLDIQLDTREFEITAANLMVDQETNDYVDIRITYPNGEDYTVLAKKPIKNLSLGHSVFYTYMNEDEILRYTCAVVDAFQTTGARIYTTRYVESNLQEEAVPNYLVRSTTIDLINSDPNIYEQASQTLNAAARLSLESRLGQLTEEQLNAVSDGFGLENTAKGAVLQENVENGQAEIESLGIEDEIQEDTPVETDDADLSVEDDAATEGDSSDDSTESVPVDDESIGSLTDNQD